MKRKSLVGLLLVGLLLLVPVLAACGVTTTEIGDGNVETPHVLTGGFANCFICHTGGQSPIPPATDELPAHSIFPLEQCADPRCHPVTAEVAASLVALESEE